MNKEVEEINDLVDLMFNFDFEELKKEKSTLELINKQKQEIDKLNKQVQIMERYLELIYDLGYDYDGFNKEEDLKSLIDELCRFASLGRACNTTEYIYGSDGKRYNILHEELKGE
jgi:hypothetical protein